MRRIILPTFVFALISVGQTAFGQVTTNPVGFVSADITPATDATHPKSTVVSTPFYDLPDFQGAVSSVDSTTQISISGAAFTVNQFSSTPHLARFKSGPSVGRFFLIASNTATQLTLNTTRNSQTYNLTTSAPANALQLQVNVGDQVEILLAHTLGTLFGTTAATVPLQQATSAQNADNVLLFNGTNWDTYYYNNSANQWRSTGFTNRNDTIVFPDNGMFIVRRGTAALKLTFLGNVPSTTEKTDIRGPASSMLSVRFPVATTLGGLALQNSPGWQAGTSAQGADNVLLFNGTSWDTYYFNSNANQWRSTGFTDRGSTPITIGSAMFIVRQSSAQGTNSTFVQVLPYTL
jgi:uncharacterized protein (TIGR02597 family)